MTYTHPPSDGHVLIAGICNDTDIALVREIYRDEPAWKLPGGQIELGEKPEAAARREFLEETGIPLLDSIRLHLLLQRKKTNYRTGDEYEQYLYAAGVPTKVMRPIMGQVILRPGEKGEEFEVTTFKLASIDQMPDFFEPHREVIRAVVPK